MNIKVLYPLDNKAHAYQDVLFCAMISILMAYGIVHFANQVDMCNQSVFSLSLIKILQNSSVLQCPISYDKCLCSVTSNRFNNSRDCINIVHEMIGRILPPLTFIMEIYIIYQLFSLTGTFSYVLRSLLWIIVFLVVAFITTVAYDNICLHLRIIYSVCLFAVILLVFTPCLMMHNHYAAVSRRPCTTSHPSKIISEETYNCTVIPIVIVPQP